MIDNMKKQIKTILTRLSLKRVERLYVTKFFKYSFKDCKCKSPEQFEASITRLYHTLEKGLSYTDYRAGFGADNVNMLIISLEQYSKKGYDTSAFFYETALSCLQEYIRKNKEFGHNDDILEKRILKLPGKPNTFGGTIVVEKPLDTDSINYKDLVTKRHSIRHFSNRSVDVNLLVKAVQLAQFTPSACNRQGWKTRIVADKAKIKKILENQNGNRGFGHEFDKLLIVTADLRAQQKNRELFQAYIDGGMYAESVLNSLYFYGVGSVPLSASLTMNQEKNVREITGISDAEILILFVGVGNYPDGSFLTTRSERKHVNVDII